MKRSLSNLSNYSIKTKDGSKGKIKDFLFDEEKWIIRYIDADFGNLFSDRRILIPTVLLGEPDWEEKVFPVNLSEENINTCPGLEDKAPVSREYESELSKHYNINFYWLPGYTMTSAPTMLYPPRPFHIPEKEISEDDIDTNLRSYNEITGYHIDTTDGRLGQVNDIIIDEEDLQIVYAIIDTSSWMPWSKQVIIPVNRLQKISYVKREVSIDLHSDTIKSAPEYKGIVKLNVEQENALHDYYKNAGSQ